MKSPIHIPLDKSEVLSALQKALDQNFIDNLRDRHKNIALDSKLRGYVGELAFKKWMLLAGIEFENSNVKDCNTGMDIDFVFKGKNGKIQLELKTSLIPDIDETIEQMANKRDIKLIKRKGNNISELYGDIHVQLVFKQLRLRKDDWLCKQEIDLTDNVNTIYQQLAAYRYETDCYLLAWIDKESLINTIESKPTHLQSWKYGKREFWCCNIEREGNEPRKLIEFLKNHS